MSMGDVQGVVTLMTLNAKLVQVVLLYLYSKASWSGDLGPSMAIGQLASQHTPVLFWYSVTAAAVTHFCLLLLFSLVNVTDR